MKKILLLISIIFNFEYSYADNKIVYIDINNILVNSTAGQLISKHIQNIKENKNKEFSAIEKKLLDKEKDIIQKKNIIETNEFEEQVILLNKEVTEYNVKKKDLTKKLMKRKLNIQR